MDVGRYQRHVGCIIYLSLPVPDITYDVSVISQFMHAPTQDHMEIVYRILRYLKGCPRKGILYQWHRYHRVEAYIDADWASSISDSWSASSYCTFIGGNLVTWYSKKVVNDCLIKYWSGIHINGTWDMWVTMVKDVTCKTWPSCSRIGVFTVTTRLLLALHTTRLSMTELSMWKWIAIS